MTDVPAASRAEVRLLSDLRRRRERRDAGLVLVEGPTLLGEALAAGLRPQLVGATRAASEGSRRVLGVAAEAGARVVLLADHEAARASDTEHGTGLLAAVAAPPSWSRDVPTSGAVLLPVLWGLQDPGNVGTLIRSARAFGALACLLGEGTADPVGPKALRASAGAGLHLRLAGIADSERLTAFASEAELELVLATAPSRVGGEAVSRLAARCMLVLGHETRGVPQIPGAACIQVPQSPEVESLNVGVAGSILMADWYRARVGEEGA